MIFKNLVLQALGTIRFRFLQKKSKKNFHACVPLSDRHLYRGCADSLILHTFNLFGFVRQFLGTKYLIQFVPANTESLGLGLGVC